MGFKHCTTFKPIYISNHFRLLQPRRSVTNSRKAPNNVRCKKWTVLFQIAAYAMNSVLRSFIVPKNVLTISIDLVSLARFHHSRAHMLSQTGQLTIPSGVVGLIEVTHILWQLGQV